MTAAEAISTAVSIAALFVSLASVAVAILIWKADRRAKRIEASIRVWTEWSAETSDQRKTITRHLGMPALSREHGRALAENTDAEGLPSVGSQERNRGGRALTATLNGLERLAVGVELGLYDLATIRNLGGTVIVRSYQRGEAYIEARRTASGIRGQANAYAALERLCANLMRGPLDKDRRDVDRARLRLLNEAREEDRLGR